MPFDQVATLEKALISARSVTTKIYDRASGDAEHCQESAQTLWRADFFDWMSAKFADDERTRTSGEPESNSLVAASDRSRRITGVIPDMAGGTAMVR